MRHAILATLLVTAAAAGDQCRPHAVQVQAVAGAVIVPAYGAAYQAPGPSDEVLLEILAELRALRAEVAAQRVPPGALAQRVDASTVLKARCASCHAGDAAKGGGFALFDKAGKPERLSPADKRAIRSKVSRSEMPPAPARLADAERAAVLDLVGQ